MVARRVRRHVPPSDRAAVGACFFSCLWSAHRWHSSDWLLSSFVWGVRFGGSSSILTTETENEWAPIAMSEDFNYANVAKVALIIGGVVLLLGLGGLILGLT